MKVLILHSEPPKTLDRERIALEFDLSGPAQGVAEALPDSTVLGVEGRPRELLDALDRYQPEVVFNMCESPLGRADREPHVAALLEWVGVPFTGSGSAALELCRRKDLTTAVLAAAGIPVPRANVYPCIVKPAAEDGSVGIHGYSLCKNSQEAEYARSLLKGRVVVEEFLEGREFAVSLWGAVEPLHASIGEIQFKDGLRLMTYEAKWNEDNRDFVSAAVVYGMPIDNSLREQILSAARGAWRATGARGYLRVDIRLNAENVPCVLDVNPNPDLTPNSGISRAVVEAGWTREHFIRSLVSWAG